MSTWNVIREIVGDFPGGTERELVLVDLSRDRAVDEAQRLWDVDPGDPYLDVRFVVESSDGLRRLELR